MEIITRNEDQKQKTAYSKCGRPIRKPRTAKTMDETHDPDVLMDVHDVAKHFGVSVGCVNRWRLIGKGPRYVKVSHSCVRYRRADLVAYAQERVVQSTAETDNAQAKGKKTTEEGEH